MIEWRFTEQFVVRYSGGAQGLGEFRDISISALAAAIEDRRSQFYENVRMHAEKAAQSIAKYQQHFQLWGYECPLVKQHQRTLDKGLPKVNPLVDLLLLLEMRFGVLMGVHDVERIAGGLKYDCAQPGESFRGMRYQLLCKDDEFVIRDHEGIIASYFQGADDRTCVSKNTRSIVLFAFGAPSIAAGLLEESLAAAQDLLKSFCSKTEFQIRPDAISNS